MDFNMAQTARKSPCPFIELLVTQTQETYLGQEELWHIYSEKLLLILNLYCYIHGLLLTHCYSNSFNIQLCFVLHCSDCGQNTVPK